MKAQLMLLTSNMLLTWAAEGLLLQWLASLISLTECGALGSMAVLQV